MKDIIHKKADLIVMKSGSVFKDVYFTIRSGAIFIYLENGCSAFPVYLVKAVYPS